jgi:Uma2 family endonuclease
MTVTEWEALPEDESGEIVDTLLVEEEVPDFVHEAIVVWLIRVLSAWAVPRGGYIFGSEAKFVVRPSRGRKPDLSVFFEARGKVPRRGAGRVAPDIVVEVVSPTPRDGRRDRVEKVDDYAAFGVAFYWIVDPEQRSIEILERGPDGRYVHALGVLGGRIDRVPGCPDLVLDVDALWSEVDGLFDTAPANAR